MAELRFSRHARDRMLDWNLTVADVLAALGDAETVEEYEDGSRLVLGRSNLRPIHVVLREEAQTIFLITIYVPEPNRWDPSFRHRIDT